MVPLALFSNVFHLEVASVDHLPLDSDVRVGSRVLLGCVDEAWHPVKASAEGQRPNAAEWYAPGSRKVSSKKQLRHKK